MVDSFRGSVAAWLDRTLQADIYVGAPRSALDPGLIEDLVREPRKTMEQLVSAMEIPFHETLLSPERLGNTIIANTSFTRKPGIDPLAADSWREHLDPTWQKTIEDRLGDIMEHVGYTLD